MKNNRRAADSAAIQPPSRDNDFQTATSNFEAWMSSCTNVVESDLRSKHQQMKKPLLDSCEDFLQVGSTMAIRLRRPLQGAKGSGGR